MYCHICHQIYCCLNHGWFLISQKDSTHPPRATLCHYKSIKESCSGPKNGGWCQSNKSSWPGSELVLSEHSQLPATWQVQVNSKNAYPSSHPSITSPTASTSTLSSTPPPLGRGDLCNQLLHHLHLLWWRWHLKWSKSHLTAPCHVTICCDESDISHISRLPQWAELSLSQAGLLSSFCLYSSHRDQYTTQLGLAGNVVLRTYPSWILLQ